jgi:hypothetical protein
MRSWKSALALGVLMWLVPFAVAFLAFPFHESARPLFESIMAVAVTATAVALGYRYVRVGATTAEGLWLGLIWFGLCILIDAPLMLLGGPMQMTFGDYMADIGFTYLAIPVVTTGLALAFAAGSAYTPLLRDNEVA